MARAAGGQGGSPGLARHRRERESFTRRNLLATLQLASATFATPDGDPRTALTDAIHRIYLNRFRDAADRKAIHAHLRAADLA